VVYFFTKNWIVSNLLALSFSINAITLINLDSFKTGMILLSGLFVYDIFWVFGTPVMVSVATNFDAPIKVLFPRDIFTTEAFRFTMLGLGDIVIPGIYVALCLRFDLYLHQIRTGVLSADGKTKKKEIKPTCVFPMPYFLTCFAFYFLALATTVFVMHTFKAAQVFLLHFIPYLIYI
jgi:minor histocompatibility antigen H13